MARYMDRFGFDRKPELDYPAKEMSASGEYDRRKADLAHQPQRRRRAPGHRPGQTRGDAAADGRGRRGGRQRRAADGPAPDRAHRRPRRAARCEQIAPRVQSVVMKPSTATAVTLDDGSGRQRRHGRPRRRSRACRWRARRAPPRRRSATRSTTCGSSPSRRPPTRAWRRGDARKRSPATARSFAAPVAKAVMERLLSE